jgi:uncharacterized membrane protein
MTEETRDVRATTIQKWLFDPANRITVFVFIALMILLSLWVAFTPAGILGKADAVGYAVCHRIEIRSFKFTDSRALPLCARCSGTFLGVLVGLFGPGLLLRRKHMAGFPPLPIIIVMLLMSAWWAFDGANSYTFLVENINLPHLYTPNNFLRLTTGMVHGITMGGLLGPVANSILWDDAKPEPVVANFWQYLALIGVGLVINTMVLSGLDIFLYPLAVLSAAGVVTILTLINTAVSTSLMRRENTAHTFRDAIPQLLTGLLLTTLLIGGIDLMRFLATGTWSGFVQPPV